MTRHEKINCNVVRDLLPLYVDNVLSTDSVAIVDAHLLHCPLCASELESLRKPLPGKFSGPANVGDLFRTTESSRKIRCQQPLYLLLYMRGKPIAATCSGIRFYCPKIKGDA